MSNPVQTRKELLKDLGKKGREFIARVILSNQKIAEQIGINTIDLQCLNMIDLLGGEAKPGEIAKMTGLTTGGVTVMLDRLEKKGYIERKPNPKDRRSTLIHLSPKKMSKLHAVYESQALSMENILSNYTDEELSIIIDYFSKTLSA
jgi:DNA-binding MarR family transcriptional regulator